MALLELSFADTAKLAKEGRNFDCSNCPASIQKLRRCHENRWDFAEPDGSLWPMYLHKGGPLYGFCPSKVARDDPEASQLYNLLVVIAETGQLLVAGGVAEQPDWLVSELAWFLPQYSTHKSARIIGMCFGGGDDKPAVQPGAAPPPPARGRR